MKVFAIATKKRECYGQGDYVDSLAICQVDCYHKEGRFNPMFLKKEAAELYVKNMKNGFDKIIVEINVE